MLRQVPFYGDAALRMVVQTVARLRAASLTLVFGLLLAACGHQMQHRSTGAQPSATNCACAQGAPSAAQVPQGAELYRKTEWAALPGWSQDEPSKIWSAFLSSCKVNKKNEWTNVCAAAQALNPLLSDLQVRTFFEARLQPWQLLNTDGSTQALITGYYEPLINGSRTRNLRYAYPVYGVPQDMVVVDLSAQYPELKNMRLRGRMEGRKLVPYWSREQIDAIGDKLAAKVLLWTDGPLDLFFMQVQGSGQVKMEDGTRIRLAYADQNGHPYASIGKWLVQQNELTLDQANAASIKTWAREHPKRLRELLNANPSYVFFREEIVRSNDDAAEGPKGSQGLPLTAGRSIAVDVRVIPLGAPVYLDTTYPNSIQPLQRLVLAQDTGGAIKGRVRADFYWGFGPAAGEKAGAMRQGGQMYILWPKDSQPAAQD